MSGPNANAPGAHGDARPQSETPNGTSWGPASTGEALGLYRELTRKWLVWRDEAIASGVTEAEAVGAVARAKQIEWQGTVHPVLGITPAAAVAGVREPRGSGRPS